MVQVLLRQFTPPFLISLLASIAIFFGWTFWQKRGCVIKATAENQGLLTAKLDELIRESQSSHRLHQQEGEALIADLDRLEKYLAEDADLETRQKAAEATLAARETEVTQNIDRLRSQFISNLGPQLMICNDIKGRKK